MKHNMKLFGAAVIAAVFIASTACVFAADDVDWYSRNAYLLSTNSIIKSALRWMGWGFTVFLCRLSDAIGTLYDITFSFIDVTKYGKINDLITSFRGVLIALMVLGFTYMGISQILDPSRKPPIIRNLVMAMLAVSVSLTAFNTLNTMAYGFKEGVLGNQKTNESYEIVNDNIFDIIKLDKSGDISKLDYSKGVGLVVGAGIKDAKTLEVIDINETLNFTEAGDGQNLYGWSATLNDYLGEKITVVEGQQMTTREIYDGLLNTTIGNEFYYRYKFDYISCWMQIIAYLFMIIALSYKNVRIMYELVVARILAYLHAADVTSGERLKQILLFIRDTYIVLGISVISVKLFEVLNAYVSETVDAGLFHGIGGGLLKGIITLFIAFCVIDGPNIAERLLGMDAGLSRSVARTWGMIEAARGIGRAVSRRTGGGAKRSARSATTNDGVDTNGKSSVEDVKAPRSEGKGSRAVEAMDQASEGKAESGMSQKQISSAPAVGGSKAASAASAQDALNKTDQASDVSTQSQTPPGISPQFMDQAEASVSEAKPAEPDTGKMSVDFMENGSGPEKPKTERIPERRTKTDSSFTVRKPVQKLNRIDAGGGKSSIESNKPDSRSSGRSGNSGSDDSSSE